MAFSFAINLLASKQKEYQQRNRRLFLIQVTSLSLLIVYFLIVGTLLVYIFYLKKKGSIYQNQWSQLTSAVAEQRSKEAKQTVVKTKLKNLTQIVQDQKRNQEVTEAILSFIPKGMSISGFTIEDETAINFSGKTDDFDVLSDFLVNLSAGKDIPGLILDYAKIASLSYSSDGGYNFNIIIGFRRK